MIVYRLSAEKYSKDISGVGAALYGGRWNRKGSPVLYTGESKEIALLEFIVNAPPLLVPVLDIITIEIPNTYTELDVRSLPSNWRKYPAPTILSEIAERWIQDSKTIALKVPSCIIETSFNYVLNCRHPDYKHKVRVISQDPFIFDPRLLK